MGQTLITSIRRSTVLLILLAVKEHVTINCHNVYYGTSEVGIAETGEEGVLLDDVSRCRGCSPKALSKDTLWIAVWKL